MCPNNLSNKAQQMVETFGSFVKAGAMFALWLVVAALALASAYVAFRAIWYAMQMTLRAIGIEGG